MNWPEKNSPFWPLAMLAVICTTLCICLDKVYQTPFVAQKDGLTVITTFLSGLFVVFLKYYMTSDK